MAADICQFIDIHVHILPGIDDGAQNLEASVALARVYADEGVKQIIATSHFIPGTAWAAGRDVIARQLAELQEQLVAQNILLTVYPGMEIAYHKKLIDRLEKGLLQPLADSNTYLLEPSFRDTSDELLQCAKQMMDKGYGVILAHPERIPSFQETAEMLIDLVGRGLQVQLNIGSLLNKFGEASKRLAMHLVDVDCVHYLASDAHSVKSRRPVNGKDWQMLNDLLGEALLSRICIENPGNLLGQ